MSKRAVITGITDHDVYPLKNDISHYAAVGAHN
jgi:hypothetical protein